MKLEVPLPDGIGKGDNVEVAIRPENIPLNQRGGRRARPISDRTFLATSANTTRA